MKEADPSHQLAPLGRNSIELVAEYTAATDEHERRIARVQLRAVDAERTRLEHQLEALDGLPDLWESLYGSVDGYLTLFSGLRPQQRLEHPQAGYFPYSDRADAQQQYERIAQLVASSPTGRHTPQRR